MFSQEPSNYGSFLFRVLPKLAGQPNMVGDRRIVSPLYNQSMIDLFGMVGIVKERIIPHNSERIYKYNKVIIPSLHNTRAVI